MARSQFNQLVQRLPGPPRQRSFQATRRRWQADEGHRVRSHAQRFGLGGAPSVGGDHRELPEIYACLCSLQARDDDAARGRAVQWVSALVKRSVLRKPSFVRFGTLPRPSKMPPPEVFSVRRSA